MATTSVPARRAASTQVKEHIFAWEGKDKTGKTVRGEMRAGGETIVNVTLRRQGIMVTKVKKKVIAAARRSRTRISPCSRASWPR